MNRRTFLTASTFVLACSLAHRADALTARALTLEELVERSTYVVIATAGERRSVWEVLPSGRRIVTYTRLAVERAVVGAVGTELWVRTLGGAVDDVGQVVPGEAQIAPGSRSLFFLVQGSGVVVVTSMAQGHYPIVGDASGAQRLASSQDTGVLLARQRQSTAARERLAGAAVEDALALVTQIRKASNEKR